MVLYRVLGLPKTVVAENGGVVFTDGDPEVLGNLAAVWDAVESYERAGHRVLGRPEAPINRWRMTEAALSPDADEELLRSVAADQNLTVVYTGFAYHLKSLHNDKGAGLRALCDTVGTAPDAFVGIGDSADEVLDGALVDGVVSVLDALNE